MIDLAPQHEYYRRRAAGVEEKYALPERQADMATLSDRIRNAFAGKTVLEPACGAGFWTLILAGSSRQVDAFDLHPEMVDLARERLSGRSNIRLWSADLWDQLSIPAAYEGLCAGFIWSHLPRSRWADWLAGCLRQVGPDSRLIFFDNRFVPGDSTPIDFRDPEGNTWQNRRLQDGITYPVLKNYPDATEIRDLLGPLSRPWTWQELDWFWILDIGPEPLNP